MKGLMSTILIVEDDAHLCSILKDSFPKSVHKVYDAKDLESAYKYLDSIAIDLIVSDRVLPDGDGLELIAHAHEVLPKTRTILLTHKKESHEILSGLSHGADDYMTKPFSLLELKMRARKLLSLERRVMENEITKGKITLSMSTGELTLKDYDEKINFRKKEALLIKALLSTPNAVVSRHKLVELVWPNEESQPCQATLDVYMRRIRMKLGSFKNILKTHRGFGYQLKTSW